MILEDYQRRGKFKKIVDITNRKSIKFTEESSRTIHELGDTELHDLGQKSRTVQCHSCLKHIPEGLIFCGPRLDVEQIHRINSQIPGFHGEARWQRNHWKAMDARIEAERKGHDSIVIRWQEDEKYGTSQKFHGWTGEVCRYLDHLTTIDISYTAPWHRRHRYESNHHAGMQ